jgi:peptide/histidine transporter 3/4
MMAGLSFMNLLAFVFCAMRYKCKKASWVLLALAF